MGVVKCSCIKDNPKATIEYITNPEKTKNRKLVSGINVSTKVDLADKKMNFYRERYQTNEKIKARHFIHSFSKKEKDLTPEQAHEISMIWFRKMFPETAIAVAATHCDTDTYHTHFLVNNVTTDGKRVHSDLEFLNKARSISNELCKEYGLEHSIVAEKTFKKDKKSYYEYQNQISGTSYKDKLRDDIDNLISKCLNLEDLYNKLGDLGYSLKLNVKYPSIKPPEAERYIRFKTLGYYYAPEQLKNRIEEKFEFRYVKFKNNKSEWIPRDIYILKHKRATLGNILAIGLKIVMTQIGIDNNCNPDRAVYLHRHASETSKREIEAISRALDIVAKLKVETKEDLVAEYNKIERDIEMAKKKNKPEYEIEQLSKELLNLKATRTVCSKVAKKYRDDILNELEQKQLTIDEQIARAKAISEKMQNQNKNKRDKSLER